MDERVNYFGLEEGEKDIDILIRFEDLDTLDEVLVRSDPESIFIRDEDLYPVVGTGRFGSDGEFYFYKTDPGESDFDLTVDEFVEGLEAME